MRKIDIIEEIKQKLTDAARLLGSIDQYSISNDVWNAKCRLDHLTVSDVSGDAYLRPEKKTLETDWNVEPYEGDIMNEGGPRNLIITEGKTEATEKDNS